MIFVAGKLYKTNTEIWFNQSWLPINSVFIFLEKEPSNATWISYKFIYKQEIVEFEFHIKRTMSDIFSEI